MFSAYKCSSWQEFSSSGQSHREAFWKYVFFYIFSCFLLFNMILLFSIIIKSSCLIVCFSVFVPLLYSWNCTPLNFVQRQLSSGQVLKHINLGDYLSSRVPSLKGCSGQKPNGEVKASSLKLLAHIMQFLQRLVRFFVIWKYYHNFQLLLTLVWKEYRAFQSVDCLFFGIILHTQQLCF